MPRKPLPPVNLETTFRHWLLKSEVRLDNIAGLEQTFAAKGLTAIFETKITTLCTREPFASLKSPRDRKYFILLKLQNDYRGEQVAKLQREVNELELEQWQGVPPFREFFAMYKPDKATGKMQLKTEEEQRQAHAELEAEREHYRRKQAEARKMEQHANEENYKARQRNRAPTVYSPVNWFKPMPVFSEREPFGYAQATLQERHKIGALLKQWRAVPCGHLRNVRGRPLPLYGFKTNLRVLEHWLKVWLPPKGAGEAWAAIFTTAMQSAWFESEAHQQLALRKILLPHARKWFDEVFVDEKLQWFKDYVILLLENDDTWNHLVAMHREQREKQRHESAQASLLYTAASGSPGFDPFAPAS